MKNIPEIKIHAWIFFTFLLLTGILIYVNIVVEVDAILENLLWALVAVSIYSAISWIIDVFSNTSRFGACAFIEYSNLGILKSYKSFRDCEYVNDLVKDLKKLSKKHYKEKYPVIFMGTTLNFCLNSEAKISNKISSILEKAYFNFYFCDLNNRELIWRKEQIEKISDNNKGDMLADVNKIFHNITSSKNILQKLREKHDVHIKYKQYIEASPFATICIINEHIYYTPNLFRLINWSLNEKYSEHDIRPSFLISRNSPLGKRIEELFQKIYTYDNIS